MDVEKITHEEFLRRFPGVYEGYEQKADNDNHLERYVLYDRTSIVYDWRRVKDGWIDVSVLTREIDRANDTIKNAAMEV